MRSQFTYVDTDVDGGKGRGQERWGATKELLQHLCEGASRARLPVPEACVCNLQMTFDLTSLCLGLLIFKDQ